MNPDIQRVLSFWFDRNPLDWIVAPSGFDAQCRTQFGELVHKARQNELDDWTAEPEGSLALVVLLDQLPRNIYRGTPEVYAGDAKAWGIATGAIARDFDKHPQLSVVQASAFYMPLLQQEGEEKGFISAIAARGLFEALKARAATPEEHKWVDMGAAGAKRHADQLVRFGRYPTRNKVLGRESTEAEVEFLAGHSFSLPSEKK